MMDRAALRRAKILLIDDEPTNIAVLERLLRRTGYDQLMSTTDSREARALFVEGQPDLVLLDLAMPYLDGFEILEQLKALIPPATYLPILVLTADVTFDAKRRALEGGARDFLTKPFDHTEVLLRIENLLETRVLYQEIARHNAALEETVRVRTQQLLQTEKLATMGQLLAGVAHELNNPLAVILGRSALLGEAVRGGPLASPVEKIGAAAERCTRIVRNFLGLARQRPQQRGAVDLNRVVREALELVAYDLRTSNVEVVVDLADTIPSLWADEHELGQVVVNLLTNARQAMRDSAARRRITVCTGLDEEPGQVRLELSDTGPGVPPELHSKIFDSFFTTKPPGEGTGLGLSLCRRMIEEHGGRIRVEGGSGSGARFIIELPPGTGADPAPEPTSAEGDRTAISPRRILVVDDEPDIAALIAESLQQMGHRVDVAGDGAEALDMLARQSYDVVITDTKMPGVDGVTLYREVARRFPELQGRIVFVTGDVLDRERLAFIESTGAPVVMKPFEVEALRRLVTRILAVPRAAGSP